jgi:hypothetical protein
MNIIGEIDASKDVECIGKLAKAILRNTASQKWTK